MTTSWETVDLALLEGYLDDINEVYAPLEFNKDYVKIRAKDLSFYPGYQLLELIDSEVNPNVKKYFIYQAGDCNAVDYTNAPLYKLNKECPVEITEENVHDYIRFFFRYVRGRHGRFIIIDSVDEIEWKKAPPEKALTKLRETIKPSTVKDGSTGEQITVDAFMLFKDSLFRSDVKVDPDGQVNLENEQLVIENMPIVEDDGFE